jgi:hypothetical protein
MPTDWLKDPKPACFELNRKDRQIINSESVLVSLVLARFHRDADKLRRTRR